MTSHRPKCVLNWSSGKDCAYALHLLRATDEVEVVGLLTTVNERFDRVAMHGVRRELLEAQAEAVGLPLTVVSLPWPCSNEEYERRLGAAVYRAKDQGVELMAFGDLFLRDVREYRERQLGKVGMEAVFPLWGRPTDELAREMMVGGLRAIITCVDTRKLDRSFVGREWDAGFLGDVPTDVDPCGENGEFHTFVHDGPMFSEPMKVTVGEVVERDGFLFSDVRLR